MDNKYVMSTSPATCLPSMTTLPPVQVTSAGPPMEMYTNPNKGLLGGVNILRAALTGSNDVIIINYFLISALFLECNVSHLCILYYSVTSLKKFYHTTFFPYLDTSAIQKPGAPVQGKVRGASRQTHK